jgi:membrane protease YdiL (CAAX protease family)
VVLTWLYNRSGGSVLLVAAWHGTYNLVSGTDGAEGTMQVVVSALVIALAVHLVVQELQARRAAAPGVLAPAR